MSRYIRTKDGIHSVDAVLLRSGRIRYSLSNVDNLISKEDLEKITIREAKTIEELCDGVIEKCLSGNRFHYIWDFNKQEAMEVMNIDINKGYKEFYFGIFVNHNNKIDFISVAKLNDKGELELI